MSQCTCQMVKFAWNAAMISKKAITFEVYPNVPSANINRPVLVPFWSTYRIVMVKLKLTQSFHTLWTRKCSVFAAIHRRKVNYFHQSCYLLVVDIVSIPHLSSGNDLARHLAICDRKTAYDCAETAQSNTVKCNMLDMLGLVRRDGEDEEDSSDGLLIPADQQQQLLSKSIDRDNEIDPKAQSTSTQNAQSSAPNAIDDFNTQLSLDDLAPPQSVAPPEPDRTPQLSDEYQVSYSHKRLFFG